MQQQQERLLTQPSVISGQNPLALCDEIEVDSTGKKIREFEVIFSEIFRERG